MAAVAEVHSDRITLPARAGVALQNELFLSVPGDGDQPIRWWVFECDSDNQLAFAVQLQYQLGGDTSGKIFFSVGRGMRCCFPARSFTVLAANLDSQPNTVGCRATRVSAPVETRNAVVIVGEVPGAGFFDLSVPAMARTARFEVGDNAAKANATIELITPFFGSVVSHHTFAEQPPNGVVLGDTKTVRVTAPVGTWSRVVFGLHL